jgi:D-glycero-D-manno-heptose 1,7-bisphosphate phosphatase
MAESFPSSTNTEVADDWGAQRFSAQNRWSWWAPHSLDVDHCNNFFHNGTSSGGHPPSPSCFGSCYHKTMSRVQSTESLATLETVFLDRDGVVNEKMPDRSYVTQWSEFKLLPGAVEAIGQLNRAGLRVVVISNQRGIALGLYTAEDVREIHERLQGILQASGAHVDGFYFCAHDMGQCNCRKPLPGLFERAVADFPGITARRSAMIGDSESDIEFGRRLGMITVFIDGETQRQKQCVAVAHELADLRFSSLYAAANGLLAGLRSRQHSLRTT